MRSLLTIILFITTAVISSCRKSDNPRVPDLTRVPMPLLVKDTGLDQIISAQDPASFTAKYSIDMLWKDQPVPKSVEAVMIKNEDKTNVISLLKDISTYPTSIDITGQQLIDAFGEPIELGDKFDFGVNITLEDGSVIPAFPKSGETYGTGVFNQPGVSPTVRYEAVCSFTAAEYAGNFEVELDEWADYAPGTVIPVTVVDETTLSFKFATNPAVPILVKVNTANNSTSVDPQVYGDYPQYGITDIMCQSVENNPANFVAPCDKVLSVRLTHFDAAGSYGAYTIRLKKVE